MGYGNDIHSIFVMPENDLKRKLSHTAGAVASVDPDVPLGVGLDVRQGNVYADAEKLRAAGGLRCAYQSAEASNSAVASG